MITFIRKTTSQKQGQQQSLIATNMRKICGILIVGVCYNEKILVYLRGPPKKLWLVIKNKMK